MKERPILFNGPMVRAILEGRKTQTRRVLKTQPLDVLPMKGDKAGIVWIGLMQQDPVPKGTIFHCRHGQPGDRLWVRETFQGPLVNTFEEYHEEPSNFHKPEFCEYAADGGTAPEFVNEDDELVKRWRPSIHMPRWASRITLEITGVRVERLQDISEANSAAEGIAPNWIGSDLTGWVPEEHGYLPHDTDDEGNVPGVDIYDDCWTAKRCYQRLWESINGSGAWGANPWVWVIEFKVVKS